jgi:hypothetical protein
MALIARGFSAGREGELDPCLDPARPVGDHRLGPSGRKGGRAATTSRGASEPCRRTRRVAETGRAASSVLPCRAASSVLPCDSTLGRRAARSLARCCIRPGGTGRLSEVTVREELVVCGVAPQHHGVEDRVLLATDLRSTTARLVATDGSRRAIEVFGRNGRRVHGVMAESEASKPSLQSGSTGEKPRSRRALPLDAPRSCVP